MSNDSIWLQRCWNLVYNKHEVTNSTPFTNFSLISKTVKTGGKSALDICVHDMYLRRLFQTSFSMVNIMQDLG